MAFFGFLIFWAISFVAGQLLRAATTKVQNAKSDTVEQPRTEEGQQIPVVFGTVKLGPSVLWFGDVKAVPVKKRIETSIFGTSKKQTIGYKYLVGMQGGLCWGPVDALVDIIVADKKKLSEVDPIDYRKEIGGLVLAVTASGVSPALPQSYAAGGTAFTIDAPFLLGGPEKEGGIDGTFRFYFGSGTQTANSYLATKTATSPFPTYKGLCYAVWEQVDMGQSARIEPWQFIVRRCPTTLGTLASDTSLSRIGDGANPAEIIYELWTDTRWGLGESSSALDTASFLTALQTLSDEGLGISGTHLGGNSADEKIKEILRTIDGVLVPDPLTGKLKLTLIRADYDTSTLETFTASNSSGLTVARPDWDELTTEVKVRYTDTSQDFTTRTRVAYNPAVRQALGKARGAVVDYPLLGTGEAAEAVAVRDLKALSSVLATGSVTTGRAGATLTPGDPFILDYPDRGLSSTVVRATRVNYGTINGNEAVEIQFTEDVFGVRGGVFVTTPPASWTPPTPTTFGNVEVIPTLTLDDTQGCVTLDITGQTASVTLVEMQRQQGGEAAEGWVTFAITDPPMLCVDRDDRDTGTIAWRVTVTQTDGTTDTIEDEAEVPPLGADDGNAQGTPGNLAPWTLQATPPVIVRNVGADTTEPVAFKPFRHYFNTNKVGAGRIQVGNHRASGDGVELPLIYSLDGGTTFAEAGPTVRLDRINFPEPGAYTPLVAGAIGPNVMLNVGTKGGDGTTVIKVGDIVVDFTSSATPPDSPSGDPPDDDTPPSGGDLGDLILDYNARTLLALGWPDLRLLDYCLSSDTGTYRWPDDTGITGDSYGLCLGLEIGNARFRTSGFGGGSLPCVQVDSSAMGFCSPVPTVDSCTFYFVVANLSGGGTAGTGSPVCDAPIMVSDGSNHSNGWVTVRADGKIQSGVNTGPFGNPTKVGTIDVTGPTAKHIIRFAWQRSSGTWNVFVDGTLDITLTDALVNGSNTWAGVSQFIYGNAKSGGVDALPLMASIDYGRILCYNKAHFMSGLNAVELVLQSVWGTP